MNYDYVYKEHPLLFFVCSDSIIPNKGMFFCFFAFLTMPDYINCLLNFWDEVDIFYADRTVVIPLLGTGITPLRNYGSVLAQEKLELLLWSFKVSRIKFTYPANVTIVIYESLQDKINFYKLKETIWTISQSVLYETVLIPSFRGDRQNYQISINLNAYLAQFIKNIC